MTFQNNQVLEAPVVSGVTLDADVARVTVGGIARQQQSAISTLFQEVAARGVNVDIIVHDSPFRGKQPRNRGRIHSSKGDVRKRSWRSKAGSREWATKRSSDDRHRTLGKSLPSAWECAAIPVLQAGPSRRSHAKNRSVHGLHFGDQDLLCGERRRWPESHTCAPRGVLPKRSL